MSNVASTSNLISVPPSCDRVKVSKTMTYFLRHGGSAKGVPLDEHGWAKVSTLLTKSQLKGVTVDVVKEIVKNCNKQRFKLKEENDDLWICANQGHSIKYIQAEVTELSRESLPSVIVHGTFKKHWKSIKESGLYKCSRQHIHLAPGLPGEVGVISGMRSDCDLHIYIDASTAMNDGLKFYKSSNDVILCAGDANGYILPRYFYKVIDVETGRNLME